VGQGGEELSVRYASMLERLRSKGAVSKTHCFEGTPCIEWSGKRNLRGYGHVTKRINGKPRNRMVHREILEQINGRKMRSDHNGLHLCNNPPCFNELHLKSGTQSMNAQQMMDEGRHPYSRFWEKYGDEYCMSVEDREELGRDLGL
jgi:hypothetical protein